MVGALIRTLSVVVALGLLMITSSRSYADDKVNDKLFGCSVIKSDLRRLTCYDQAFGQHPGTDAAPSPRVEATPASPPSPTANGDLTVPDGQTGWTNKESASGLDNSKTEVAILPAASTRLSRFAESKLQQHAALIIRCKEGKTDLYIGYTDLVDGMEHTIAVQYRVGNEPVKKSRWGISQDFESYGTWQTAETIPLIKSLLKADEFYVRGDAGSMGTSEASFKLAGIEQAVAPVRQSCHW
jgi:type VI secretion system protein VasI